jgi:hypothetical protein
MNNKYIGTNEFEGYILETDIPLDKWCFGNIVNVNLYQPERLSEKDRCIKCEGTLLEYEKLTCICDNCDFHNSV